MFAAATEDTLLALPIICRARRPRHCWNSPPAASREFLQPARRQRRIRSTSRRQRRFRVMENVEELQRALDFPWEKWTVFLHPEQREWVERDYAGPARVSGSAGTGKTIVALHRAAHLARTNPDARVLLTTFSDTLAHALQTKLKRLVSNEPRLAERIDVYSLDAIGLRLYKSHIGQATLASREVVVELLREASHSRRAATNSACIFSSRSGSRSSMRGSWKAGKRIATSHGSAERPGCRRRSARCCGRSSSEFVAGLKARSVITHAESVHDAGGRDRQEQESAIRLRGR